MSFVISHLISFSRYMARGVSASKEDVHAAIANVKEMLLVHSAFQCNDPGAVLLRLTRDSTLERSAKSFLICSPGMRVRNVKTQSHMAISLSNRIPYKAQS